MDAAGWHAIYKYTVGSNVAVLAADNVLHIKGMGNGTTGLDRLDYMRASTAEANAQGAASTLFANHGKISGVLMIDKVLNAPQRAAVRQNFIDMAEGGTSRFFLLKLTPNISNSTLRQQTSSY